MPDRELQAVLRRAVAGCPPSAPEAELLLATSDPESVARIASAAREVRDRQFGRKVFLYGFLYLSTHCRNRCTFCFYRSGNDLSPRYRKTPDDALRIAGELAASGVHLVDLTLGEDPVLSEPAGLEELAGIVSAIHRNLALPVMVSPGVLPRPALEELARAGADWYALYQETHTPRLFARLRLGQSYRGRARARAEAARAGLLVEDGVLLGAGESPADRARSVEALRRGNADQVRAMGFVPQAGTPLARRPAAGPGLEELMISVLRLAMPERLIPASLDVNGLAGLRSRLDAGANVVTSLIPPRSRLAGVSQSTLDIEEGLRTVEAASAVVGEAGLAVAGRGEYQAWMESRRAQRRLEEPLDEDLHRGRKAPGPGGSVARPRGGDRDGGDRPPAFAARGLPG